MSQHKVRGFEKISPKQWHTDAGEWVAYDEELAREFLDDIKLPKRGTSGSAGYDVFSPFGFVLREGQEIKLPTGIKSYMQSGEMVLAFPRSSLGFKYHLKYANSIPVVDEDYHNNPKNEGHIWLKFRNEGGETLTVKQGDAVGQFVLMPFLLADDDDFTGEKRVGGIGSTS